MAYQKNSSVHPYTAVIHRGGKSHLLGCFRTAEQAALCYTRAYAEMPLPPPPPAGETAEEALEAAKAAGLTLQRTDRTKGTKSGYRGVTISKKSKSRPFRAEFRTRKLGGFATAEGAAFAVAQAEAFHQANPCSGRKCTCALPWLVEQPAGQAPAPIAEAVEQVAVAQSEQGPVVLGTVVAMEAGEEARIACMGVPVTTVETTA